MVVVTCGKIWSLELFFIEHIKAPNLSWSSPPSLPSSVTFFTLLPGCKSQQDKFIMTWYGGGRCISSHSPHIKGGMALSMAIVYISARLQVRRPTTCGPAGLSLEHHATSVTTWPACMQTTFRYKLLNQITLISEKHVMADVLYFHCTLLFCTVLYCAVL